MIIIRYLVRETLKSQIAILFILLLISFVRTLSGVGRRGGRQYPDKLSTLPARVGRAENGAAHPAFEPVSRLVDDAWAVVYESEITVMHACGLGKRTLIIAAMIRRCSPLRSRR